MVWRIVLLALCLSGPAFGGPAPDACKERCIQAMMECLNPCAQTKSKNPEANLECIRACRQKHQPCLKSCEKEPVQPAVP